MELIGMPDRMAALVPKYSQTFVAGASFDLQHLAALKPHQTRVGKIERDRYAGNAVWREPVVRKPDMRTEGNIPPIEFDIQFSYIPLQSSLLEADAKVAQAQVKKLFVRPLLPGKSLPTL